MTNIQAKLNALKREGIESATRRGHEMGPFHDNTYKRAEAHCMHCARGVWVTVNPPSDGIAIYGEAVVVNCDRRRTTKGDEWHR
jgi:hypothetical protein